MCRYLKDREHSAWAAGWLAEMGTTSSILPLMRARRWHPFDRETYTAAITQIERRHAEQTTAAPHPPFPCLVALYGR
jgi:hypothetical protein